MNLTTATPAEIDAKLAELYMMRKAAEAKRADAIVSAHRIVGDHGRPLRGGHRYNLTDAQALTAADELRRSDAPKSHDAARIMGRVQAATGAIQHAEYEIRILDAEFTRRGGWSRFFLVTSSNGHIHSSQECSTCRPTTDYGWLPEASGQTMAEAIVERDKRDSAALLCTVCFPDAPVEWTVKPVDDTVCPGSGTTDYDRATARRGYYSGNFGICNHCGQAATIPGQSAIKMRKHKKA